MSPLVLLLGSLAFSFAFNVAWAWGGPLLSVVAAAACTLIVPAALHLWPQVPAHTWARRAARAIVMTGICAAAAITSFQHAVAVLSAAGWTDLAAWSVTGGAELLTTLSTMALRAPAPDRTVKGRPRHSQNAAPSRTPRADTPVRLGPDTVAAAADRAATASADSPEPAVEDRPKRLSAARAERSARFHAWAATLPDRPSEYQVRKEFSCRQSVAQALLAEFDERAGMAS